MGRLMTALTVLLVGANVLAGDKQDDKNVTGGDPLHPRVKMETTLGDIVLELDAEKAPITVLNFIDYVQAKYYDGTIFHRVIKNFVAQGGGFTTEEKKTEGLRAGIKNEWKNGLKNLRGAVVMARMGGQPDSATSQFFINCVDNPNLDQPQRDGAGYAVFGKVIEGTETVRKIRAAKVGGHPKIPGGTVPAEPIVINSVQLISEFDRAGAEALVKAAEEAEKKADAQAKAERVNAMQGYIEKIKAELGTEPITTNSGLTYFVLKEGEGESPKPTDRVEVHYTGWLLDGTKFDSSHDRGQPATFALNGVIPGWTEGVGLMKVGGKSKLIIPPKLGYGKRGSGNLIPPDSVLVFDIQLRDIASE